MFWVFFLVVYQKQSLSVQKRNKFKDMLGQNVCFFFGSIFTVTVVTVLMEYQKQVDFGDFVLSSDLRSCAASGRSTNIFYFLFGYLFTITRSTSAYQAFSFLCCVVQFTDFSSCGYVLTVGFNWSWINVEGNTECYWGCCLKHVKI